MTETRPHWEGEMFHCETVPKDIVCKNCMFQMSPVIIGGVELKDAQAHFAKFLRSRNTNPTQFFVNTQTANTTKRKRHER